MGVGIDLTRQCASYLPRHALEQVSRSLTQCHLDHCAVVWASASNRELSKLQIAMNRAIRLILGRSIRASFEKMFSSHSGLTVEKRLTLNAATFLNNTMCTLCTLIPEFCTIKLFFAKLFIAIIPKWLERITLCKSILEQTS